MRDPTLFYKLVNKKPEPCTIEEYAKDYRDGDWKVAQTKVGRYLVSTVFLHMDHNYGDGQPLLFETMIFIGRSALNYQVRYHTWPEAEAGHQKAMGTVKYLKRYESRGKRR